MWLYNSPLRLRTFLLAYTPGYLLSLRVWTTSPPYVRKTKYTCHVYKVSICDIKHDSRLTIRHVVFVNIYKKRTPRAVGRSNM
ncbi:hypothetical protein BCR34DRAFT_564359 [Clohesyomyces aquaticus]|uniref:Uncharacterized protein n=1 Tax=Clohesyomyces aquaticus TaxID=1231657 RepID=A0A1Y1ZP23_9PLEO|nr:hypothetical protein BCR34DRAFT_564359 [Clohesyomyces aquaticus]